ncbi:MAG: tautomerase family protein [Candidatus Tectomicrobia bacterium]|nr:tautomerase family protein [Candidatus Tectomicrobia bacterium]
MATVIVNTTAGKTMAQKRAVIAEITDTVEKHFKLPRGVIRVYVNEVARTNVADGGVIFAERDKKAKAKPKKAAPTNSAAAKKRVAAKSKAKAK